MAQTRAPRGAFCNPFRTGAVLVLTPDLDEDLEALAARFRAQGRGVLVGPHGSGKTTTLEALVPRLPGPATWLRLRADPAANARAVSALPRQIPGLLVIDGLEQLAPWTWWSVRRRADRILATSHREGRLPLLYRHRTSPPLLARLIERLQAPVPEDLEALVQRHDGDLRACLRELYDRYAGLETT